MKDSLKKAYEAALGGQGFSVDDALEVTEIDSSGLFDSPFHDRPSKARV